MGNHVLLVGMMGAGKSTVGRVVAERTHRPYRDTDAEVERRTGQSVAAIFEGRGEAAFRAMENAALCSMLASPVPLVVAVGGGAVVDPESRRRLRDAGTVVWLDAPWRVLARRTRGGSARPLLEMDPNGALRRLDALRRPIYRQVSDVVVQAGHRRPEVIAEEIARAVEARPATSKKGSVPC
ncbi:MAG: shikimate kinase [Acidimicrobiales bacterium]|jgi:shikimate kinase